MKKDHWIEFTPVHLFLIQERIWLYSSVSQKRINLNHYPLLYITHDILSFITVKRSLFPMFSNGGNIMHTKSNFIGDNTAGEYFGNTHLTTYSVIVLLCTRYYYHNLMFELSINKDRRSFWKICGYVLWYFLMAWLI